MVPLALIANLATTTWIGLKFGHQVAPLALFAKLATRLRNLRCHIVVDCPIGIISYYWVGIIISQSHIS